METANDIQYDFHKSYEEDWKKFIAEFPGDSELDEDVIVVEIKRCCYELNRLIQYLYTKAPSYATQIEIRFKWRDLEHILEEYKTIYAEKALSWFVKQIINMINSNNSEVVKSIWYAIGVDYFECGTEGYWLFPKIYQTLPERHLEKLIRYSISIPWKDKVETYRKMSLNTHHHAALADALYFSCEAFCHGSCKSSEAIEILKEITISEVRRKQVFKVLTTPIQVEILEVIEQTTLPNDEITGFVSIHQFSGKGIPTWFPYAELWIDNTYIGTFDEDYCDIRWRGWNSINTKYNLTTPEEQKHQEHILCVKVPFNINWKNKKATLKPV